MGLSRQSPSRCSSNREHPNEKDRHPRSLRSAFQSLLVGLFLPQNAAYDLLFAAALPRYATVSAKQRKTFRSNEWKNRPKAQDRMLAPCTPPVGIGGLLQLNDLVTWPLVRIGETFQILFEPVSGNGVWTGAGKVTSEIEG